MKRKLLQVRSFRAGAERIAEKEFGAALKPVAEIRRVEFKVSFPAARSRRIQQSEGVPGGYDSRRDCAGSREQVERRQE